MRNVMRAAVLLTAFAVFTGFAPSSNADREDDRRSGHDRSIRFSSANVRFISSKGWMKVR